ncbi:hypothetical protein CSUI_003675 [Cystoisospora suis]|uniref:Uncharacterized protein n=1 Tax=Cystoisospora suis TaxID=483139 RepID=A0A2C6L3E3_9APIC|nr:hypothetical protein CSUI_003675 [Cystoisospora suis]
MYIVRVYVYMCVDRYGDRGEGEMKKRMKRLNSSFLFLEFFFFLSSCGDNRITGWPSSFSIVFELDRRVLSGRVYILFISFFLSL